MQKSDIFVSRIYDVFRVIRRAVIDHDYFEWTVRLLAQ